MKTEKVILITAPYWIEKETKDMLYEYFAKEFPNHKTILSTIGSEDSTVTIHFYGCDKDPATLNIPIVTKVEKVNRFDSFSFYLALFLFVLISFYFYKIITL